MRANARRILEAKEESGISVQLRINSAQAWLMGAALVAALLAHPSPAAAQFTDPTQGIGVRPELLKEVGIDQKLNDEIPLNLTFRDEHGNPVELAQFFGSKPVILTLVYYNCPMLCTQVLNGLDRSLQAIPHGDRQGFQRRDGEHRSDRQARCWPRPSRRCTRECTGGRARSTAGIF